MNQTIANFRHHIAGAAALERTHAWSQAIAALETPIWLVGGAIRDWALERSAPDFDLVAPRGHALAVGRQLAETLGGRYVLLHADFGACRIVLEGGRWLDLTDLQADSIEADLRRRDLTVNALALAWPQADNLLDPTGGLADLAHRTARRCSSGSLLADPVRSLRVVRFAAELGFEVEKNTATECREAAVRLTAMPGERVWEELRKILAVETAAPWIATLDETGILDALLPSLAQTAGFAQPSFHHLDVRDHSIETAKQIDSLLTHPLYAAALADPADRAILRLAALLHDFGKPATAAPNQNGQIRFHGHAGKSAKMAAVVAERLRLSNVDRRRLTTLIESHMRPHQLAELLADKRLTMRSVRKYFQDLSRDWLLCLSLARADLRATAGPDAPRDGDAKAERLAAHFVREASERMAPLGENALVRGEDILALGVEPGPHVGAMLDAVAQARFENPRLTRAEALALVTNLASGVSPPDDPE